MPRLELKGQPPVPLDGHGVDDREPEPVIKLSDRFAVLCQLEHKAADVLGLGFPLGFCRLELLQLGLGGFVPLCQAVVAFQVSGLVLCRGGIFLDAPLGQLGHHLHFGKERRNLAVQGAGVGQRRLHGAALIQQPLFIRHQRIEGIQEPGLDLLLSQVRCLALFFTGELAVASPDGAPVFVGGMPDLGAEESAAIPADQPGGKDTVAAVAASDGLPALQFPLHQLPLGGVDDGRVAVLHIVLWYLAFVFLLLFGEEVHRERFLAERKGFEPLKRYQRLHDFQSCALDQLSHLSVLYLL